MFAADPFVREAFRFFSGVSQNSLRFVAQRQIDRGGDGLPRWRGGFDLLANAFEVALSGEKPKCQGFVFPQQAEQEMLSFNVRSTELARLIPCEEDDSTSLFCVALEHSR